MTIVETVRTHIMDVEPTNATAFRRGDHDAFGRLSRASREVLGFSVAETADLLDETVAAVNSALQRARVTLRRRRNTESQALGIVVLEVVDCDVREIARFASPRVFRPIRSPDGLVRLIKQSWTRSPTNWGSTVSISRLRTPRSLARQRWTSAAEPIAASGADRLEGSTAEPEATPTPARLLSANDSFSRAG